MKVTMDELVNYCKQYGLIFQGSEIYNGLANSWDYGPVGTNLKENIRKAWKKKFIQENPYNVGLGCDYYESKSLGCIRSCCFFCRSID